MYRKIGLLPGISILAILFIHANGFGINALLWWTHRYQTLLPIDYNPIFLRFQMRSLFGKC